MILIWAYAVIAIAAPADGGLDASFKGMGKTRYFLHMLHEKYQHLIRDLKKDGSHAYADRLAAPSSFLEGTPTPDEEHVDVMQRITAFAEKEKEATKRYDEESTKIEKFISKDAAAGASSFIETTDAEDAEDAEDLANEARFREYEDALDSLGSKFKRQATKYDMRANRGANLQAAQMQFGPQATSLLQEDPVDPIKAKRDAKDGFAALKRSGDQMKKLKERFEREQDAMVADAADGSSSEEPAGTQSFLQSLGQAPDEGDQDSFDDVGKDSGSDGVEREAAFDAKQKKVLGRLSTLAADDSHSLRQAEETIVGASLDPSQSIDTSDQDNDAIITEVKESEEKEGQGDAEAKQSALVKRFEEDNTGLVIAAPTDPPAKWRPWKAVLNSDGSIANFKDRRAEDDSDEDHVLNMATVNRGQDASSKGAEDTEGMEDSPSVVAAEAAADALENEKDALLAEPTEHRRSAKAAPPSRKGPHDSAKPERDTVDALIEGSEEEPAHYRAEPPSSKGVEDAIDKIGAKVKNSMSPAEYKAVEVLANQGSEEDAQASFLEASAVASPSVPVPAVATKKVANAKKVASTTTPKTDVPHDDFKEDRTKALAGAHLKLAALRAKLDKEAAGHSLTHESLSSLLKEKRRKESAANAVAEGEKDAVAEGERDAASEGLPSGTSMLELAKDADAELEVVARKVAARKVLRAKQLRAALHRIGSVPSSFMEVGTPGETDLLSSWGRSIDKYESTVEAREMSLAHGVGFQAGPSSLLERTGSTPLFDTTSLEHDAAFPQADTDDEAAFDRKLTSWQTAQRQKSAANAADRATLSAQLSHAMDIGKLRAAIGDDSVDGQPSTFEPSTFEPSPFEAQPLNFDTPASDLEAQPSSWLQRRTREQLRKSA